MLVAVDVVHRGSTSAEQRIVKRINRAKLFIFLREHRYTLFDEAFQQKLATMYKDVPQSHPPTPPVKLGLAAILQTYTGVSDDELIEAMAMDRRWQLVLDCLDAEILPFSKPTFTAGSKVVFPADRCSGCALRPGCTTIKTGRSVCIHRDERLMQELREHRLTTQGRARLRERVPVAHSLAHIGHWQGNRARYRGERKNLFDLRRTAVVHNLHVIARAPAMANAA